MKGLFTTLLCALALAAPAAGWADGGGSRVNADTYTIGYNVGGNFTALLYETTDCATGKTNKAEKDIADIFARQGTLGSIFSPNRRLAFYKGLFAGWMDETDKAYRRCHSQRFQTVPLDVIARAAAVVLNLIADDLGPSLNGKRQSVIQGFDADRIQRINDLDLERFFAQQASEEEIYECDDDVRQQTQTQRSEPVNDVVVTQVVQQLCR